MNLNFVYVSRSDIYKERLRDDWQYIYEMASFFRWWLREKFSLYYTVNVDALVIEKVPLMRLRFGMSDLMKYHREKGENIYHFYLSYFKPRFTDCDAGFFDDNLGLVQWKEHNSTVEKRRFFALENCSKVSHVILHEVGRQKDFDNKKFKEEIHEQWDRHVYGAEPFEFYDKRFQLVSKKDDFMFATMKIPEHKS